MQLQFRIDDTNHITVDFQLSNAGDNGTNHSPEVTAAIITDKKLSLLSQDQIIDLAGQCIDHL